MSRKSIREVRQNIAKRKNLKKRNGTSTHWGASMVQEEEKHGYFPSIHSNRNPNQRNGKQQTEKNWIPSFVFKALLAAIIFFSTAIILRVDSEAFQRPKAFLVNALTEEFPFARVQGWYRENLGTPFAFMENKKNVEQAAGENGLILPVNGVISQSFQQNGEGVLIEAGDTDNMEVTSMKAGSVVFAGNKRDTGKTIVIQHADGTNSIYGHLNEMDVFQYQFVSRNEVIGSLDSQSSEGQPTLYFAIQEDQRFIDPVKVMQVDDQA
ncbi:M23 family metallopeptidase [Virgibacillus sp. MSP4-1]|uniref:M23 family metallopeptidase n=1 Tax=Virgibacillus sp. MSP4-1 TaxID=2700081 RepID=UPI00039FEA31|nr:M23 family metallopeptidase [Virgibacillus sp. MSP4-1]QHS22902.1 M23 family metallopeptidase [Virgibacillus sp. MSP4-1]